MYLESNRERARRCSPSDQAKGRWAFREPASRISRSFPYQRRDFRRLFDRISSPHPTRDRPSLKRRLRPIQAVQGSGREKGEAAVLRQRPGVTMPDDA